MRPSPVFLKESMGRGIIRSLVSQFTGLPQAMLEVTDNPLDFRDGQKVRIDIRFDRANRRISVLSLGGRGMDVGDFDRWLRWGESGHHAPGDIGAYGQGGKAAVAFLGDAVRIWARKRGSPEIWLLEDNGWRTRTQLREFGHLEPIAQEDAPLVVASSDLDEGCVLIEILECDLNRRWNTNVLRRQMSSVYRSLLSRGDLEIKINGESVKPLEIKLDDAAPKVELRFEKLGLRAIGWAGRLDRRLSDDGVKSGLRLYTSGRLIVDGEWFGFNWTGKGSYNHLIGELEVSGFTPNLNKAAYTEGGDVLWEEMGKELLSQMHPLLSALRSSAESRVVTLHEKVLARAVRKELAATLRDLQAELASRKGDEADSLGRKPRQRRERKEGDEEAPKSPQNLTGRKNQPRTPAPQGAVGTLQRTLSAIQGLPRVEIDTWDGTVRSVLTDEGKGRVLKINAAYPMYRLSGATKAYLAETILLEVLQADPDVTTKGDLISQLDVMLRRWSQRAEADQQANS